MINRQREFASLAGKTALVTGASSGIGRAIAEEFAAAGARVIVHYSSSKLKAQEVVDQIQNSGGESDCVQADFLTDSFSRFCENVWKESGPIDIWVNNAGVDLLTGEGATLTYEEKLERLLRVDVTASVRLSKLAGNKMKEHGTGTILTIGWDQADRGMEGDSAELFSTAKNAVMGFTRSLAVSLAPEVRVNCIAPGWIRTAWGDQASQDWQERVMNETPLKRWGLPEDLAKLARFLVSDDANYLTGQVINANGGAIR
ncbi:3-oxoacyl-[acyl-carrier-protein] reductase FabG [Thalassoglobus neptunius]|uniref:3-oxoacyl-[acyl-carrier-protein] reductase FabG n=1 Tax=Thalassoglobus neptunius TaxID=1938619 RepID=A0A5C5X1K2_9PLAN|nr:SDR family oxidoreductase [Thalassoglobus neptunius]TWT56680.1 3-oxoacyl-[acyl-carrier-protein] reductase FabG [Thalassoglobus neptunius]